MVIFYVLLILPAQRRQKKTQAMLNELKTGDKVVTNGGLYGTIVSVDGDAVQLRIADQVKVKVVAFGSGRASAGRQGRLVGIRERDVPELSDSRADERNMNSNSNGKPSSLRWSFYCAFFGLVGLPAFPTSLAQVRDNFTKRIKLGLDLQGGTHLILQVQVNEAVSLQTDQTIDHLTSDLRDKNIRYDELRKVSDTQILVHNLAPESTSAFRDSISSNFAIGTSRRPRASNRVTCST